MNSPAVQRVLERLRESGREPRQLPGAGRGWSACCPAHDDHNPSLEVSEGDDGRALVKCHAGCTAQAVVDALGLKLADLFADHGEHKHRQPLQHAKAKRTYPTAEDAIRVIERATGKPCVAAWSYADASGGEVLRVVRVEDENGKDYRPIHPTDGGWCIGDPAGPLPLYRLDKLRSGERVYVVEGEKAADAGAGIGLYVTTSAHGAKSASKTNWQPLASASDVVILPDNDGPGREYAEQVAGIVLAINPAAMVRIVDLPGANVSEGDDLFDWLEQRDATPPEPPDVLRDELERMADDAPRYELPKPAPADDAFIPFPVDVLPEPMRGFVEHTARAMGCDPSFVALPLLAAVASAIGNTRRIELKRGWTEPAILWTAIVGESGSMKSPAMEASLQFLHKRQHQAFIEHQESLTAYEHELADYETQYAAWKKNRGGDPPMKPTPPPQTRYVCSDVTVEALALMLRDNWRGVLLSRDELAAWLGGFDRYSQGKGGDAPAWLEMFGGRTCSVDRKTGINPTVFIPRAAVSITGGIQPGTLQRALGRERFEDGMAARLLLVMPPRRAKRWTEESTPQAIMGAVDALFEDLLRLAPTTDERGEPQPGIVELDTDAKRAWIDFYNDHAKQQAALSGDMAAAWSKLEGYAARLALVVHVVRWLTSDTANAGQVDARSIAAGVALSRWFGHEAQRVYAVLHESDDQRGARRLVEWIAQRNGTTTARELTQSNRDYRAAGAADAALQSLVETGRGTWEQQGTGPRGGRPSRVFRLAAGVNVNETPQTAGKSAGFVDVDKRGGAA
ncbi:MAG: YfjI family protein [Phycisphaerales bacterium]